MRKIIRAAVCAASVIGLFLFGLPAYAASVQVTLPGFDVTLSGVPIDNTARQYPLIIYKDITYFPMTYNDCRFLGLESTYTPETGLDIKKTGVAGNYIDQKTTGGNPQRATARTVAFSIRVNGKTIDNSKEEYPLLLYKDITYFPLTWRFAVDEFGWEYRFDSARGLTVNSTPPESSSPPSPGRTADPDLLISSNWAGYYDDHDKPISTEVTFLFSGQQQDFSVSALSNMKLTRNGIEIEFSLSGNVSSQPGRGSSDVRTVFFAELSKPLTEPGVYVMTGVYMGKMFTTAELQVE
ncbi:MAG: hypothetical protein LBL26_13560 [Peptococcaceae bacterium]|nr:hypothetical protein [Peptococcaceae bacterium]